jgi:hypothetical protein
MGLACTMIMKQCTCNHAPEWLEQEIRAGRSPQKYVFEEAGNRNSKYVLICTKCGNLWDHAATDRLIDLIFSRASPEDCRRAGYRDE